MDAPVHSPAGLNNSQEEVLRYALPHFVASDCPVGHMQAHARTVLSAPALAILPRLCDGGGIYPSSPEERALLGELSAAGLADWHWVSGSHISINHLGIDCIALSAQNARRVAPQKDAAGHWRWLAA